MGANGLNEIETQVDIEVTVDGTNDLNDAAGDDLSSIMKATTSNIDALDCVEETQEFRVPTEEEIRKAPLRQLQKAAARIMKIPYNEDVLAFEANMSGKVAIYNRFGKLLTITNKQDLIPSTEDFTRFAKCSIVNGAFFGIHNGTKLFADKGSNNASFDLYAVGGKYLGEMSADNLKFE